MRRVKLEVACREGALMETSRVINFTTDLALSLPTNTPERAREELDAMLYTTLKQTHAEVHCVAEKLQKGYEKSLADIIWQGTDLAKM